MMQWVIETLTFGRRPMSTNELHDLYVTENETPKRKHRSARHSMTRALRTLSAAKTITQEPIDKQWSLTEKPGPDPERIETAYHEAGHAVIALATGGSVAMVTIKAKGRLSGVVHHRHRSQPLGGIYGTVGGVFRLLNRDSRDAFGNKRPAEKTTDAEHAGEILSSIAGPMVHVIHLGDAGDTALRTWRSRASPSDLSVMRYHRRNIKRPKSVEEYAADTLALVNKHWPMIEAVAAALLKDETLSGGDVDDVCQRVARKVVKQQRLKSAA